MTEPLTFENGTLRFHGAVLAVGLDLTLHPGALALLDNYITSRPRRGIFWHDDLKKCVEYYTGKRGAAGYCLYKRTKLDSGDIVTPLYLPTPEGYRHSFPTAKAAEAALKIFREKFAGKRYADPERFPLAEPCVSQPKKGRRRA